MKKILTSIKDKCAIMKNNTIYNSALNVLNKLSKEKQRRLRYQGNKFIKRFSFYLRVFKKLVDKRLEILRKVELARKKKEAAKKKKGKKGKGKKKFFLEMSSEILENNLNKNAIKNSVDAEKKKKKGKKGKKGKSKPKNALGVKLPNNNAYDKKFLRETELSKEKARALANFVIRAIDKINRV